ncbi:MAG TPA: ATP-binding protein [Candidatus Deferrimicrobium sp.]|nr:ATP-binding protein [Candidatus Deferrimicrobium sp.]
MTSHKPKVSNNTRSGARRAGDEYQDVRAALFLVQWLLDPSKYRYAILENNGAGALDDITALTQDGKWILIQVKYTLDTQTNPLTFEYLLDKSRDQKSLLEKWSASLRKFPPEQVQRVTIETNRPPDRSLEECLTQDRCVDLSRVDPSVCCRLFDQLGEEAARELFGIIDFSLSQPGISQVESFGRDILQGLNPSCPEAWDSLMKSIGEWIINPASLPNNPQILLADVRAAARWHVLRGINERFHVPNDTIAPDDDVLQSMVADLDTGNHVLELTGPPGSGKSTLLTVFARSLEDAGNVVLRHHFFVSISDATPHRYSAMVTIESLMGQIRERGTRLLGREEERMSPDPRQPDEFRRWLEVCAGRLKEQQHRLIVIIDGLDHAYRESQDAREELEGLFQILLPPPDGMYVVIGSQVIPEGNLPDALVRRGHDRRVRVVPRLSVDSVESWLEKHGAASMNVDPLLLVSNERRHKMAVAIIAASGGLPLAFRLLQHQAVASGLSLDEHSMSRFPEVVAGDIEAYYNSLWARLSQVAHVMLCLLVQFSWPWPVSGICQCMEYGHYSSGEVKNALLEIRHLLSQDPGPVTVFHISLAWFVKDQADFRSCKAELLGMVAHWLERDAPEIYQRAHLWMVQARQGNTTELVRQPERSWLVDSLRRHTPRRYISQILGESGRNALKEHRFDFFARRSVLQDYVSDIFDYDSNGREAVGILLAGQLTKYAPALADQLLGEIGNLSDDEIRCLFEHFQQTGDQPGARKCLDEIQDRMARNGPESAQFDELTERLAYCADMRTCLPDASVSKFLMWIQGNRKTVWAAMISADCGKAILRHTQVALAHDLLKRASELEAKEMRGCFPWLYALLIEQRSYMSSDVSSESLAASGPWPHLLLMASRLGCSEIPLVTLPNANEVFALDDPMQRNDPDRSRRIVDLFFSFFVSCGTGHEDMVQDWCDRASATEWISTFVHLLAEAARSLFRQSVAGSDQELVPLYAGFAELDPFPGNEQREDSFLAPDCRKALADIMLLSSRLNSSEGKKRVEVEVKAALSSKWFLPDRFVQSVVDLNRGKSWSGVADIVCQSFVKDLYVESEEGFMGCAKRLALYSEFARQAGIEWMELADLSCEYLVGYGNHKDILMFDLLECAEELSGNEPDTARSIIGKVSGPALSVLSFTDGRETHGLPNALASAMVSVCPDRILPYSNWLQNHERYGEAAHAFACWMKSSAFDTNWDCALSATSSDSESILELQKRSETDSRAQSVLAAVEKRFGGVEGIVQPAESEPSTTETKKVEDLTDPSLYPPDRLGAFLSDARPSVWNKDIVAGWLQCWIERGEGKEAVNSLEKLNHRDWRRADTGIETYRQIRSIIGKDAAFVWLVRANQGIRGWLSYYWNANKSEDLWNEVRTCYPENWLQFIEETVYDEASNESVGTRGMLVRLTRYLVFQGQADAACDLAQGASVLLEQLIPTQIPLELTRPEWLEQPAVSAIDNSLMALLNRLYWPTPDVASASCEEIAALLTSPDTSQVTTSGILRWLVEQKSEYRAAMGLLPVVYAREMSDGDVDGLPTPGTLLSSISQPSPLASGYLRAIGGPDWLLETCVPQLLVANASSKTVDEGFVDMMVGNGVPRIFPDTMLELSKRFGADCIQHMHSEWRQLVVAPGSENMDPRPDIFWDYPHSYVPIVTHTVETYLSAYLRTLSWLVHEGSLTLWEGEELAAIVSPAILGFWRTKPVSKPVWWPWLGANDNSEVGDSVRSAVEVLTRGDRGLSGDSPILRASGRVASGSCPVDLDIMGYLTGSAEPPRESTWEEAYGQLQRAVNLVPLGSGLPTTIATSQSVHESEVIENTAFFAASTSLRLQLRGIWDWTSLDRGVNVPSRWLALAPLTVRCEQFEIAFECNDSCKTSWIRWNSGLENASPLLDLHESWGQGHIKPSNGAALFARRSTLDSVEERTGMHLVWLCRVRVYSRKNNYGPYEIIDSFFPVVS